MINYVLPRDLAAEQEALRLVRELFDKPEYADDDYERAAHIAYRHSRTGIVAEARSALLHGSQLELSVRGDSSAMAARALVAVLRAYRQHRNDENRKEVIR